MRKLSLSSIVIVIRRNYMSFKKLLKISIFPNLFDPLLFLLAIGFGLSASIDEVDGIPFFSFVASGLTVATAMKAATAEVTVNAFIQMRIEKTYHAIAVTPVNLQDIVIGQVIWAAIRSVIFGSIFLIICWLFGVLHSWTAIFIPILLFITGFTFGLMGIIFAILAPNRDYLNYYNVLVIQPMYMFSGTFFPVDNLPTSFQRIAWFSPLYHASNLSRGLSLGNFEHLLGSLVWLLILILILFYLPIILVHKKLSS